MPKLLVNPSAPAVWEIQLNAGVNRLGRGAANDFKLAEPTVSGSHCEIVVTEQSVVIKDLGSTNGTFVNRALVREAALREGDRIHLGGLEMIYAAENAAALTKDKPQAATVRLPPPPGKVFAARVVATPASAPAVVAPPAAAPRPVAVVAAPPPAPVVIPTRP
ncbi:MAG: FHA domain-containing protein [Verrucomicrobiota bacterium]|jgi:pSer/pThr/pTyr-binding forkhead associated (FHA) protein